MNPDLNFSHSFGKEGSANGLFKSPRDIAIDSQGLVYVADCNNNRIQRFTPNGKFVAQFGSKGSGPGQLISPCSITIDTAGTGLVYVSKVVIIVSQSSLVMVCLLVVLEGKVVILISLIVQQD